jgi:hydrogenase maturation factor HypE
MENAELVYIPQKVWNIKNNKVYEIINEFVINATNCSTNQIMVLYKDSDNNLFVREVNEFKEKFVWMLTK